NYEQRILLFKYYLSKVKLADDVNINELAKLTEGYTASDIRDIVQSAHIKVVKEMFKDNLSEPRPITMQDFKEILKVRMPSVNPELIKAYEAWTEKFKAL
ncbi:MAG: ATP-binding protein, partial [Sulfolobaceae archaeon]